MANFPLPKGYQRMFPAPLDGTDVFTSLVALEAYASTNGTAYTGQICAVDDGVIKPVPVYKINFDKSVTQINDITDGQLAILADLEPVVHVIANGTVGMGATATTVATRTSATVDGWYSITDEGGVCDLLLSAVWQSTIAARAPWSLSAVTNASYVIGTNNEDIIECHGTSSTPAFLLLPSAGLAKKVTIRNVGTGDNGNFVISTSSLNAATQFNYVCSTNAPFAWWTAANQSIKFVWSNSTGDTLVISADEDPHIVNIEATTMISILGTGNSGGWFNAPWYRTDGTSYRASVTPDQIIKLDADSAGVLDWYTGSGDPNDVFPSELDGSIYLRSEGWVWYKSGGVWYQSTVQIPVGGGSGLTLGTTSTTAFRGDYGNTAYNHSQATHAPSDAINETAHDLLDHTGLTGIIAIGTTSTTAMAGDTAIPSISGLLNETSHDLLDHTGLTGIPAAYSLPIATSLVLGGVKPDGTTITVDAGGVIARSNAFDTVQFNSSPTVGTFTEGKTFYDATNKTLAAMINSNVTMQIGQEELSLCYNNTGVIIPNGKMVYVTGAFGDMPTIALARADNVVTAKTIGMTTQEIGIGASGFVTNRGIVHDIDTHLFAAGDELYLSDSTAGEITNVPVTDVIHYQVKIGIALVINATTGSVLIRQIVNNRLSDLSDLTLDTPLVDQVIKYAGNGVWINGNQTSVSAGAGVSFYIDETAIIAGSTQSLKLNTLSKSPSASAESIESVSVANSTVLIDRYLYNTALGGTQIDAGVWVFNTYNYVDSDHLLSSMPVSVHKVVAGTGLVTVTGTGTSRTATVAGGTPFAANLVDADITASGLLQTTTALLRITGFTSSSEVTVETLSTYTNDSGVTYSTYFKLFTDATVEVNQTAVGLTVSQSAQQAFSINPTDKLCFSFFARTTSVQARTLYLYHGGTVNYTHVTSPLVVRHNELSGLQGGSGSERYHLSATEATNVSNLGSAAYSASTAFATAAQGILANTAVQPAALGTAAAKNIPAAGNASVTEVVYGTDTRLADARTPTAHASTHITGAADAVPANMWHGVVARATVSPLPTSLTTTTFTLAGNTTTLQYYRQGTLVTVNTAKTTILSGAAGLYYIYFNDAAGTLANSSTFPGIDFASGNVVVATALWNGTNLGLVNDERHNYKIDWEWHSWAHNSIGARWRSGIDMLTLTGTGATATMTLSSGSLFDEDLSFTVSASSAFATPNAYRLFYQTSLTTYAFVNTLSTVPFYRGANNRPNVVNQTGYVLTEVPSATNRYVNFFCFGIMDVLCPIYIFCETMSAGTVGAGGYTSVANAQAIAWPSLSGLGLSPEMKPLYRIIVRADGAVQAHVALNDYRSVSSLPQSSGSTSTSASAVSATATAPLTALTVQGQLDEISAILAALLPPLNGKLYVIKDRAYEELIIS